MSMSPDSAPQTTPAPATPEATGPGRAAEAQARTCTPAPVAAPAAGRASAMAGACAPVSATLPASCADDAAWVAVSVTRITTLGERVREFELAPVDPAVAPAWEAGAHLVLRLPLDDGWAERPYSLVGLPSDVPGRWRMAVQRAEASRGGSAWLWQRHEGETLWLRAPVQRFPTPLNRRETLLVAGGIGVTPLVGLARRLAERGVTLRMAYAARRRIDLVYEDALRRTLGERLATFVSAEGQRLDLTAEIARLGPDAQLLLCGPLRLLRAAQQAWADAGRAPHLLRYETFGGGLEPQDEAFWVRLPQRAERIDVPPGVSLLEALEGAGVAAMSDCRRGECGLCAMRVIELQGRIDHRDVFLDATARRENHSLCACVSRVRGGGVVLDTGWRPDPPRATG